MLWTDEKVDATVTAAYIHSHLRANEQDILQANLSFGAGISDQTYLDWILSRAKLFFLILTSLGIPDQIFGIVDDCFDDEDLPIAEAAVPDLRLSYEPDLALDKRFYKIQFRYLTRVLEDGEHIRYADEETVPVTPLGIKSIVSLNKEGIDTVKLPLDQSRVFVRRRIHLDTQLTEERILAEIADMKRFSHEHVLSVFGSYLQGNTVSILLLPAPEYTLKSFLMDIPKSFESLPKSYRRQTLMNWPHCLANALAWLHANGGHHGAIRPSNIHVDRDYQISLGPLDGDGSVLTLTTKSDDIESYQYAPPERWKRAVTVQSTGSGKVSMPSGGRSARKAQHELPEPADPSRRKRSGSSGAITSMDGISAYAFLATSKSERYTRFRLSTAVNPEAVIVPPPRRSRNPNPERDSNDSRSTIRATDDRGLPGRTPSVLSQTSSEERRKSLRPRGIFVVAPENRTAMVQTWKSVQHDSFAADVFSLGAVIMDVLTILCKRTYSSFARHRSAKNRNAGRGGGLADASFHANLGQTASWAEQIANEAEKKVRKDDSKVLGAVGPVIQLTMQCLERIPEARLKSSVLEQRLVSHIKSFAHMNSLHCYSQILERAPAMSARQRALEEASALQPPIQFRSDRSSSRSRQATIEEEPTSRPSDTYSASTRPTTSRTMVPPHSPPSVSLSSLPSMSFDLDARSDTTVGAHQKAQPTPRHRTHRTREAEIPTAIQTWELPEVSTPKQERWDYKSTVDPSLTLSTNSSEHGGVFTYINYSTSPSEDGEEGTTYHYPLPPAKPPTRSLPPLPPAPSTYARPPGQASIPTQRHRHVRPPRLEPTRDEAALESKLSRTAIGGTLPPRMSSLNANQSEDGDEDVHREKAMTGRRPLTPAALKLKNDRRERVYRVKG